MQRHIFNFLSHNLKEEKNSHDPLSNIPSSSQLTQKQLGQPYICVQESVDSSLHEERNSVVEEVQEISIINYLKKNFVLFKENSL